MGLQDDQRRPPAELGLSYGHDRELRSDQGQVHGYPSRASIRVFLEGVEDVGEDRGGARFPLVRPAVIAALCDFLDLDTLDLELVERQRSQLPLHTWCELVEGVSALQLAPGRLAP